MERIDSSLNMNIIDINKLPDGWETITLEQFNKTLHIVMGDTDDVEIFVVTYLTEIAAVLLNVSVDDIRKDMSTVFNVVNRLTFFLNPPEYIKNYKGEYNLHTQMKLDYDSYITLTQIMQSMDDGVVLHSLGKIVNLMLVDKSIDVNSMNMMDVYQCFFLHKKQYLKFLLRFQLITIVKYLKLKVLTLFKWRKEK